MAKVVVVAAPERDVEDVLPALPLLAHEIVRVSDPASLLAGASAQDLVMLVDACTALVASRAMCRRLAGLATGVPVVAVVTEGGLSAVRGDWEISDVILSEAGPAEIDARLRLASDRSRAALPTDALPEHDACGDLVIDASGYVARLRGRPLDLTYKEFELLRCLVSSPGRVFSRAQILEEVWGYDYYGGTRTVDVHIRRLRAKLGPEHEGLIGTVRNVGYRYVDPRAPM